MLVSLALVVLLLAGAAGVALAARWVGRPIPLGTLALFVAVAAAPFPRAFVSELTLLPLDHAAWLPPWMETPSVAPYNPFLNDVVTQILPWAKETRLAFKAGELPLRNRWNACGMPLAANSVSATFSPFTILSFLLPLARGYTLTSALKLLLAGAGMWLWTRELGASARAAAFAGTLFALSFAFAPPWLMFPQSAELALWPWLLFLVERAAGEGRGRAVAGLTILFVLVVLAGHPETAVMGFFFAALWLGGRALARDLPRPRRVASAIAIAAAVAVGLTAFLLIPSLFAIAGSGRLVDARRPFWSPLLSLGPHAPVWRMLATPLFPHTLGNGIASPMLPLSNGSFPELTMGYFGIVGWAAAGLVLRPGSRRGPRSWILAGIILVGWAAATAAWPVAEVFSVMPGVRYLFPVRFHAWEALAGPALAALQLDRLANDAREGRARPLAAAAPALALAALAAVVYQSFRGTHALAGPAASAFHLRRLAVTVVVLAAAALLLVAARRRPGPAIAALTLLGALELLFQWRGIFRLDSPGRLFPETPLVAYVRAQAPPFRVAGQGPPLFPSTNVFAGVEDIRSHDAVERHDYLEFLDATCGYKYEYFKTLQNLDAPALDFLNVRYVATMPNAASPGARWRLAYSGTDGRLFENARVLPRAFAPASVRLVPPADALREPLSDANAAFGKEAFAQIAATDDWAARAWILGPRGATASDVPNPSTQVGDYRESTNEASFTASAAAGPAWIVLSLVQDGGWSASASGGGLETSRANGPFLAVRVPAGTTAVRLRYRPPGWNAGLAIGGGTAVLLGVVAFRRRRA
ncbi:MAG TPA: YfhO family protein [Thermoanaerobaculia bacterium]|nr:YfhO family protein [Thermoanaerobaculia bacterium]